VGDAPLCVRFPRLYSISLYKRVLISDLRVSRDGPDR
jgi:hypothetical protein